MFPVKSTSVLKFLADGDPSLDNDKRMDVLIGHDPAGTSIWNVRHWK
jgi:hypothetical protein